MQQIMTQGSGIHTASSGQIRLMLNAISVGPDLLLLLTGGDAHIGAVALAGPDGLAGAPESRGHREGALAAEIALEVARCLGCRVAVACGIHYDNISAHEIGEVLKLARELAGNFLVRPHAGETRMLSLADIQQFEEYIKSGELEREFRNGPEEKRLELLELLEGVMNVADMADEVATRLIFRGSSPGNLPPN